MMRNFLLFFIPLLITPCHAQNWSMVGGGLDNDVRCFYGDTGTQILYAGGSFWSGNGTIVNGVSDLVNQQWDSLNGGTELCNMSGCNPVVALCKYNNEIYAGGFFSGIQNVFNTESIAKWDGSNWQSVGGTNGIVLSLIVFNNNLYATGNFDTIGNIQAFSIARFDGTSWFPVADSLFKNETVSCSGVYQSDLYVGGTFHNSASGINCIASYDGTLWAAPGLPVFLNSMFSISTMCSYQNRLFVGGYFNSSAGAPGNGIATWDGNLWLNVGGGLKDTLGFPANVFSLCVHANKLIAGGTFKYAGGVYACNIAQWDDSLWCSFGSYFNSAVQALVSFDDTLYVGGGFWSIDGNSSFQYVAKWIGGNFVDSCGVISTGVEEKYLQESLSIYPNPVSEYAIFEINESNLQGEIIITDQFGREVRRQKFYGKKQIEISVADLADGMYFYQVVGKDNIKSSGKFIVQH